MPYPDFSQQGLYPRHQRIAVTPTISAAAIYAAGDALGGLLEFPLAATFLGGSGYVVDVTIIDDDKELAPIDLVLFNQTFTPTADNAPFDPTDADMQNCIGFVNVAATDYSAFVDNSVAAKCSGLRMPFAFRVADTTKSLWGQMVVRSAPTYTAVDDLTVILTIQN